MKILLKLSYDGTNYFGFQRQPNVITVQEKIEDALKKIYSEEIITTLASRTDTGVHALGQVVTYTPQKNNIPTERLPIALNTYLPNDIIVTHAELKEDSFHPRYNANNKTYEYKILISRFPIPQLRNYSFHYRKELDFEKMNSSLKYFIGTHDFSSFSSSKRTVKTTIRTINNIELSRHENIITLKISGNGFLYNMVRIIAGTILEVGKKNILPEEIPEIILSKDRRRAGRTLSPGGLTLISIDYD